MHNITDREQRLCRSVCMEGDISMGNVASVERLTRPEVNTRYTARKVGSVVEPP